MDAKLSSARGAALVPDVQPASGPEAGAPLVTRSNGQPLRATRQPPNPRRDLNKAEALELIRSGYVKGTPQQVGKRLSAVRQVEGGASRLAPAAPAAAQDLQIHQNFQKLTTKQLAAEWAAHQAISRTPEPRLQAQLDALEREISSRINSHGMSDDELARRVVNSAANPDMSGAELSHFLVPMVLEKVRQGMGIENLTKLFVVIARLPGEREDYVAQEILTNLKRALLDVPPESADAHTTVETNSATLASSKRHADVLVILQRHFPGLPVGVQNDLRHILEQRQHQLANKLTALIASSLATHQTRSGSVADGIAGIELAKKANSALLHLIDHPLKDDAEGAMEGLLRSFAEPQYKALGETFILLENPNRQAAARALRAESMMRAMPHAAQANKPAQHERDLYHLWKTVQRPKLNRPVFGPDLKTVLADCMQLWVGAIPRQTESCLSLLSIAAEIGARPTLSDKEIDQYARQLDEVMKEGALSAEGLGYLSLLPDVQKLKALRPEARPRAFGILIEPECKEVKARVADQIHEQRQVRDAQAALRVSQHQARIAKRREA